MNHRVTVYVCMYVGSRCMYVCRVTVYVCMYVGSRCMYVCRVTEAHHHLDTMEERHLDTTAEEPHHTTEGQLTAFRPRCQVHQECPKCTNQPGKHHMERPKMPVVCTTAGPLHRASTAQRPTRPGPARLSPPSQLDPTADSTQGLGGTGNNQEVSKLTDQLLGCRMPIGSRHRRPPPTNSTNSHGECI